MDFFDRAVSKRIKELEDGIQQLEMERFIKRNIGEGHGHINTSLVIAIHRLMVFRSVILEPWELCHYRFVNGFEIEKVIDVNEEEFINILKRGE